MITPSITLWQATDQMLGLLWVAHSPRHGVCRSSCKSRSNSPHPKFFQPPGASAIPMQPPPTPSPADTFNHPHRINFRPPRFTSSALGKPYIPWAWDYWFACGTSNALSASSKNQTTLVADEPSSTYIAMSLVASHQEIAPGDHHLADSWLCRRAEFAPSGRARLRRRSPVAALADRCRRDHERPRHQRGFRRRPRFDRQPLW